MSRERERAIAVSFDMNYKHIYHAGNFADVFKHCILIALTKTFLKKEKPMTYFETHAGAGCYSLQSEFAQKTLEYRQGVGKLLTLHNPPPIISDYLKIIYQMNNESLQDIQFYPGSPYIVSQLLRPADKMILCELQEAEYQHLKHLFSKDKRIFIHHMDGYTGLKALLPPTPRRGVVFIDSPFEKKDEITLMQTSLQWALERWETATYAIWYPIKNNNQHLQLLKRIKQFERPTLQAEMMMTSDPTSTKLIGTGMVFLNPPWTFSNALNQLLAQLNPLLSAENTHISFIK